VLHDRLRAVVTRPNGHPLLVEDRADVVRVDIGIDERNDAERLLRGSDQTHAFDALQLPPRIFEQRLLVPLDGV
jgi:hypothetical protein